MVRGYDALINENCLLWIITLAKSGTLMAHAFPHLRDMVIAEMLAGVKIGSTTMASLEGWYKSESSLVIVFGVSGALIDNHH